MILEATTPTRIDLAGGTLDIYPLYVFEGGGLTVNMGIEMRSHVRVETRDDEEVYIRSEDLQMEYAAPNLEALNPTEAGPLDLIVRILQWYRPPTGVNVITHNTTPPGSGLGSSSALLIALSGALNRLNGDPLAPEDLIDVGANLEAQSIRVPTGKQDYYAALYGGVQAITFGMWKNSTEQLVTEEETLCELENRVVLSFTGESRFSGTSNWNMTKRYIENTEDTVAHMQAIKRTAYAMQDCLRAADFDRFAQVLREEWENRKRLAEGVTNERIDRIMGAAAEAGALASKICGAGGGGCMITYAPPGTREAVIAALESAGAQHLPYRIARQGLTLEQRE